MDVDRYRTTCRAASRSARRASAALLMAATLGLTGCGAAAGGEPDVQAPGPDGQTRSVPASAQLPPPLPT